MGVAALRELLWDYYAHHRRDLPWRHAEADGSFDAYKILVSEIMLQQTQASRVIPKYQAFLRRFPTARSLADAPLADVLAEWSGLGYNRRAKYLHGAAKTLSSRPQPWTVDDLTSCKGVGQNTAAAVVAYAYNRPIPFIETNIRTIFIHHFFQDDTDVTDKQLMPLIEQAFDREHPREWSWALMDYGTHIKATIGNASKFSKHYAKQSKFEGSKRQIRGQVLRILGQGAHNQSQLTTLIADERLDSVLQDLQQEGLISSAGETFHLG